MFVVRTALILAAAILVGAANSVWHKLPWVPDTQKLAQNESCAQRARREAGISLEAFRTHYESGNLVIDARPASEFEKGHLASPMILNVPVSDVDALLDQMMTFIGMPIVLYCTSLDCDMAEEVYCRLEPLGFLDLKIFFEGWEDGILKHQLPTATGPSPLAAAGDADASTADSTIQEGADDNP